MFFKIDDWLFEKVFQPFSDWFCDRSGRSPLWLAATSMYLFIAGTIGDQLLFTHSWINMVFSAFVCLFLGFVALSYDRKSVAPESPQGALNPHRADAFFVFLRLYLVITLPIDIASTFIEHSGEKMTHSHALDLFLSVTFLLFLYFEACETKPPAPPKKNERLSTQLA